MKKIIRIIIKVSHSFYLAIFNVEATVKLF